MTVNSILSHLAQAVALLKVLRFNSVSHLLIGHSERLDCFFEVLPDLKEKKGGGSTIK